MNRSVGRWLQAWAIAAGVGLLLLIVAATATEVPGDEPFGRFLSWDDDAVADAVVPVLRFAYLMLLLAALYRWFYGREPSRRRRKQSRRVSPWATFAALVIFAVFVVLVIPYMRATREAVVATTTTVGQSTQGPPPGENVAVDPVGDPGWGWWVLVGVGAGAVVYLITRRRQGDATIGGPIRLEPASAPAEAMSADPSDPTGRVFAAYRRVEQVSYRAELARAVNETVGAHLGRLGDVTGAASPASELAGAYHVARFSNHAISIDAADGAEQAGRRLEEGIGT